jgi:hypothetical protein
VQGSWRACIGQGCAETLSSRRMSFLDLLYQDREQSHGTFPHHADRPVLGLEQGVEQFLRLLPNGTVLADPGATVMCCPSVYSACMGTRRFSPPAGRFPIRHKTRADVRQRRRDFIS